MTTKKEYSVPIDRYYTKTHEWLKIVDEIGLVGITDYAQDMLHEIVYIDLPDVGMEVIAGSSFMEIESVKSVSEIYSPVTGEIIEVNTILENSPEIVNDSPYEDGWLVKIKIKNMAELENLLSPEDYKALISNL